MALQANPIASIKFIASCSFCNLDINKIWLKQTRHGCGRTLTAYPGICVLYSGPEFLSSHSHTSVKKRRTRPRNVEGKIRKLNYEMKGNNSSTLIYCVALKPNQVSLKVFNFCHHCCSIIINGVYIFRSWLFVFLFNRVVVFSLLKVFFLSHLRSFFRAHHCALGRLFCVFFTLISNHYYCWLL